MSTNIETGNVWEAVTRRVCEALAHSRYYASLRVGREIYPVPLIAWNESGEPLELQVCDNGSNVLDTDGGVRREEYHVVVGILQRLPKGWSGKATDRLLNLSQGFHKHQYQVVKTLHGNFLTPYNSASGATELLVRPMVYVGASKVLSRVDFPDLLIREVHFTAGLNDTI